MSCGGINFKLKYHSDYSRSAVYVARELEAKSKLLRNLAPVGIEVLDTEFTGNVGVIEGHPDIRFDFTLVDRSTGRVVCFVEVTGDAINDIYAYILSEKISKARAARYPVWFMYHKKSKRMWRMFSARFVVANGEEIKWLKDEKPYLRVSLSKGWYFAYWVRWIKSHVIKAVRDLRHPSVYEEYINAWRVI